MREREMQEGEGRVLDDEEKIERRRRGKKIPELRSSSWFLYPTLSSCPNVRLLNYLFVCVSLSQD